MEIKYSVVIPVFNAENTIGKILDALLSQEGSESMEVITVDDGSSDGSVSVLQRYPVRVFRKANGGPASARNVGIHHANSDIVLFIDSDCVPQPGWLKAMTIPFANPEIFGVKGIYITRQKSLVARFVQLEFEERYKLLAKLKYIDFVDSYSAAFRIEALLKVGCFDESFPRADNEDVDLSFKLAAAGYKMVFQPDAVVEHTHPATLKKYLKVKFSRGYWRMAVYKQHPDKAVKDSYTPQSLKLQILSTALLWPAFLILLVLKNGLFVSVITAIYVLSILPFIVRVFSRDYPAAAAAPLMLFLRSNCFLAGVVSGLVRQFFRK